MLVIPTNIKQSPIHGIGVFATEFIAKGTVVWVFHEGFDLRVDAARLDDLPEFKRQELLHYCYVNPATKRMVLHPDNARFMNHAADPNTEEIESLDGEGTTIAARDIQAGEELTYNYFEHDADGERKLRI